MTERDCQHDECGDYCVLLCDDCYRDDGTHDPEVEH